jgi:alanyl-tRNA synthetase
LVFDRTPFYGESGGQAGDWGKIKTPSGAMEVEDAKKIGDTIVHIGRLLRGKIEKGETAEVSINEGIRNEIMRNHTATHLLQAALKKVLGEHVRQTGSLVDQGHLRFDFTHMKKMEPREVARVEDVVNDAIKKALAVKKEIKGLNDAKKDGAIALFGEKYGDRVRVVSVGDISKELCGGTHVNNTREIGFFKITSESSIASGIRRIEALTGSAAEAWIEKQKKHESLKLKAQSEKEEKKKILNKRLDEEIARIDLLIAKGKIIGDAKIIIDIIEDIDIDGLRTLSDKIRLKEKSAVIILATESYGKASFIAVATEDVVKKNIKAADLARELAKLLNGSGGGRPDFAQGGGKDATGLGPALEKIRDVIKEKLL